jgi:hypothetical protein
MEIRKDSEYVCPPKIQRNPPEKNKEKYCAFHEANGHDIKGCIAIRLMIKKFIGMESL